MELASPGARLRSPAAAHGSPARALREDPSSSWLRAVGGGWQRVLLVLAARALSRRD